MNQPATTGSAANSFQMSSTSLTSYQVDIATLVQGWVDGSVTNRGIMAKMEGVLGAVGYCVSSDSVDAARLPTF